MYWFRHNLTVAAYFSLADKPADAGGFTSYFLAEALSLRRTSKHYYCFNPTPLRSLRE